MNTKQKNRLKKIPEAINYLMVLGVVFLISFLFPNTAKFKYEFSNGQNWNYDDLVAPFDFAIKKSDAVLADEYKEIEENFSPYYEINKNVTDEQIEAFSAAFDQQLEEVKESEQFEDVVARPDVYRNFGKEYLENLFKAGIIRIDTAHLSEDKSFTINILEGNSAYTKTLGNITDYEEALAKVSDDLPYSKLEEPEFLLPLLEKYIRPNILFNEEVTNKFKQELLAQIPTVRGKVNKGEVIVKEGGLIDGETYQKLISYREQYQQEIAADQSHWLVFAGYFILTALIIGAFLIYLLTYNRAVFRRFNKLLFILMWVLLYSYLVFLVEELNGLSAYLIPFAIVPIVVKTFFEVRLALFTHIVIVLIASFLSSLGYEFTFLQILVGIVVLLADVNTRDWTKFFYSMFFIFITYALGHTGLSLIKSGDLEAIELVPFTWFFLNVILTLLAYPLIPLLERLFGFTSSITLMELSDMNRPLLRDMSIKAPGTLQHSLQVANLAEAAAQEIGADPLLVKVGALYHDVGKTRNPEYFIENQSGENPHAEIDNLESAKIIIQHVPDGVEMARKQRLPSIVTNFIRTHHGTTRTEYFYRNYLKDHPEEEVDESLFRYPGPLPTSKEETIVMLADSIEAACKSLKHPTNKELMNLIDKIVSGKIQHGQLVNSELSFKELEECVAVFRQIMRSVHHVRISYPKDKKEEEEEEKTRKSENNKP